MAAREDANDTGGPSEFAFLTTQTVLAEAVSSPVPVARALLLIDVPGSLRVTRELGDARAYHVLKYLAETVRLADTNTGRVVRSLGDGFVLVFDSVDEALAHAVTAQEEVSRGKPTDVPLKIRCGIHYGDLIEADGGVFGVAVYLASRVRAHAHGGEILLTEAAREACSAPDRAFNDFGPTLLPGFEDPVRVYEYPWQKDREACAIRPAEQPTAGWRSAPR